MNEFNKRIEDAKQMKNGGLLRIAVMDRLNYAVQTGEEYTEKQFEYWMDCLTSAAGWVEDNEIAAGIYRDMGMLYAAKGEKEEAIKYLQGSLDTFPETPLKYSIETKIKELRDK